MYPDFSFFLGESDLSQLVRHDHLSSARPSRVEGTRQVCLDIVQSSIRRLFETVVGGQIFGQFIRYLNGELNPHHTYPANSYRTTTSTCKGAFTTSFTTSFWTAIVLIVTQLKKKKTA